MAPDEKSDEGKQEETKLESGNGSIEKLDPEKELDKGIKSEEEEVLTTEELDTEAELDRLRFKYRGYTLEELKKNEYGSIYTIITS